MNILVVDHECHRKTKSVDFLLDLFRAEHSVEVHYYEKHYSCRIPKEKIAWSEIVVFFEFLPSRFRIGIAGKSCIFIPMYDNEWASFWQWKRLAWSGMGIISFCGKVTEHARRCGVQNIFDVRYFPKPEDFPQKPGDSKRVFLWERGGIGVSIAKKLFPPDAGYVYDVKGADEFLDRNKYIERISKCGVVIAPRRKEGIGMAFLEAMAMGKCVVAHNDATMNEYIKDGENGILFDAKNPIRITEESIVNVLNNVMQSTHQLYSQWMNDSRKVVTFLENQKSIDLSLGKRLKNALSFPFFLGEGVMYRLNERFSRKRNGL